MRNLIYRILTAVILLPIVIGAFFLGGTYLAILLGLVSLLSCLEVANIIHSQTRAKFMAAAFWALLFLPITICQSQHVVFFLFITFLFFNAVVLFSKEVNPREFEKLSSIFYWSFYVIFAMACVYWLEKMPSATNSRVGLSFILLACISTWSNDTFAYFFGRLLGKHPLFLRVSGKKTWEGFISGSLLSVVTVLLIKFVPLHYGLDWLPGLTLADLLWIAIPTIVFAPLGDLSESRLKRLYDTKDSSQILPGHGGLLDRIDALLLVIPWTAFYAFIIRPL